MKDNKRIIDIAGRQVTVYRTGTIVIGSGAAALRAAESLKLLGVDDLVVVTNHRLSGTSRNTGSDKQTYYKLTLGGAEPDSVREMAKTLFDGMAMDGHVAVAEAASSAAGFLHLVELGVPFPQNNFGEWIGYKTDHDPRQRATSAGPYTSKHMTEQLEQAVNELGVQFFDRHLVIRYLVEDDRVIGIATLNLAPQNNEPEYEVLLADNVVIGSGGPARIFGDTVYPPSQGGTFGLALLAGAKVRNITEWQFGLASVVPPWNVSGSYMQVLPRLISVGDDGVTKEFLLENWSIKEASDRTFLKGYQWPFDVRKRAGSSDIDLLVHAERLKGRKVFMDFTDNIGGTEFMLDELDSETREYLVNVGATQMTPIERLRHMNEPAYQFYLEHGVDLQSEPLEIRLSAQHHNGGLAVDEWWRTSIEGMYAVGEAAGTHGVYRPGGSALNAGQVGAMRAARHIAMKRNFGVTKNEISRPIRELMKELVMAASLASNDNRKLVRQIEHDFRMKMSLFAATKREKESLIQLQIKLNDAQTYIKQASISGHHERYVIYRALDTLVGQSALIFACLDLIDHGRGSRGSAVYYDGERECHESEKNEIQEIYWDGNQFVSEWRNVIPLPEEEDVFENVWREFRINGNVN